MTPTEIIINPQEQEVSACFQDVLIGRKMHLKQKMSFFSVKSNEQYSARYQIGINLIFDDLQVVEI